MKLITIIQNYNSSVLSNKKVYSTPIDADGKPIYAIYVSDDRAEQLINAGVAKEYQLDELVVNNSDDDSTINNSNNIEDNTTNNPDDIEDNTVNHTDNLKSNKIKSQNTSKKNK